jgi:anthranilate synthase component 1
VKNTIYSIPFYEQISPFETFRRIRSEQADSFYYESSEKFNHSAPLSIIGIGPFTKVAGSVFEELEKQVQEISSTEAIPFSQGGYFGCISYESAAEIEPRLQRIKNFHQSKGELDFILKADDLIVFDFTSKRIHFIGKRCFSFQQFLAEKPAQSFQTKAYDEIDARRLFPAFGSDAFHDGVRFLKEQIKQGEIFQGVLSERFECRDLKVDSLSVFEALREISPTPYSYFFSFGKRDFFGASPEALIKVVQSKIKTHPIAGTRPRGKTAQDDQRQKQNLMRSRKEAAEHLMLVDLARNDLGRVAAAGTVRVEVFREVQKFSNVMHLVSEVEATLSETSSLVHALKACFPAGTLTGSPKIRAMEILGELEPLPRGFYGGTVIALDPVQKYLDTCIAIRSIEMQESRAILQAGAGIVADSQPKTEYEEIRHKLRPLRQAIALAERRAYGSVNR